MWYCPECGAVNEQTNLCKSCGFDDSVNYIKYRTLCILPPEHRILRRKTSQEHVEKIISRFEFETAPEKIRKIEQLFSAAFAGNQKAKKELAQLYRSGIVLKSEKRAGEWEKTENINYRKAAAGSGKSGKYVGDTVSFGRYQYDGQGIVPVKWYIVDKEGEKCLLVSKYYLDYHRYGDRADWKTSSLREWLNKTFFTKAFNEREKKYILPSDTMQEKNRLPVTESDRLKPLDHVFILSLKEAAEYFKEKKGLEWATIPTLYAQIKAGWADSRCWMRTSLLPWETPKKTADSLDLPYIKSQVKGGSPVRSCDCNMKLAIRPALWVNVNDGIFGEDEP